ncbi:MAG: hypothetical protein II945_10125 [Bacteroidales bacterium]|nr:hypothetical protein [Bacteroidales bacterium]
MKIDELKEKLKGEKNAFPYFRGLIEKNQFFINDAQRDLDDDHHSALMFNREIKDVFGINNDKFDECYKAVANGEGHESSKIKSIRSSSLLGLLTFYKIHLGNNMVFSTKINDDTKETEFCFNEVVFEKTNRVFHPSLGLSSIDIALYGTANGKNKCVLYLESKFTEYLEKKDMKKSISRNRADKYPISKKYADYYKEIMRDYPFLKVNIEDNGIELEGKDKQHYCEGIKQMISHYIGAKNSEDLYKGLKVYLGTILYDFKPTDVVEHEVDHDGEKLKDYMACYTALAKRLNKIPNKSSDLVVIETPFTYHDFFAKLKNYELDDSVKRYYSLYPL